MFLTKVLIFCLAWCAVFGTQNKFMGGALFFEVAGGSSSEFAINIRALLGWKKGFGHCDSSCQLKAAGWDQNLTEEVKFIKTFEQLGQWTLETTFSVTNTTRVNLNTSRIDQTVISMTSDEHQWDQEFAYISFSVPRNGPQVITLRFSGSSWTEFDYNLIKNMTYVLNEKINPNMNYHHIPNRSPLTLFQPLYRIALNDVTTLRLTTVDLNGDSVHCELDNVNGPKPLPNIRVNRDCTVDLTTMESDGYVDGGMGIVALNMQDYSSNPAFSPFGSAPISSVPVQFMVQTVKSLQDPVFVSPTFEDGQEFVVYSGSTLELPVYAKPHPGSSVDIDSFHLRFFDNTAFWKIQRLPAQPDKSRTKEGVRYAIFNILFRHYNYAPMDVFGISILDKNGQVGIERHYTVRVKDSHNGFKPHIKPYFILSPTSVDCYQNSTCVFTLNSATTRLRQIVNGSVVYTSLKGDVKVGSTTKKTDEKEGLYYSTDLFVTSPSTGDQILCFEATDDQGLSSDPYCISINMISTDGTTTTAPSSQCSDAWGVDCQTLDNLAGFCAHSTKFTKKFCSDYCRFCHNAVHVCSDSQFVDCHALDEASNICSTRDPLAIQYCPRYCKYCKAQSTTPTPSTTTVKLTICETCTGFECLLSAKKVACPMTTPLCLTVVQNTQTGSVSFNKSCATQSDCIVPGSGLSPHDSECDNFDPMQRYYKDFSCRYCCSSDDCNGGGLTVPSKDKRLNIDPSIIIG